MTVEHLKDRMVIPLNNLHDLNNQLSAEIKVFQHMLFACYTVLQMKNSRRNLNTTNTEIWQVKPEGSHIATLQINTLCYQQMNWNTKENR